MEALIIEERDDTPEVHFDSHTGTFKITGKSLPEDVMEFYQPLYDWFTDYVKKPNDYTEVNFKIYYFNSASHKAINDLLDIIAEVKEKGKKVLIKWHFLRDDDDILETGHDYSELTGLDFEYVGYE